MMQTRQLPLPDENIVRFVREFTKSTFDGVEDLSELLRRSHSPDSAHLLNQKPHSQQQILAQLRRRRSSGADYRVQIRDAVAGHREAAVRYSITTDLLWRLKVETERFTLYRLDPQGRIAAEATTERTRYIWEDPAEAIEHDDASAGTSGEPEGGPATDVTAYLTDYNRQSLDSSLDAAQVFHTFHTPDCQMRINHAVKHGPEMVEQIRRARAKGLSYQVEVEQAVRQGDRFAARYRMVPVVSRKGGPSLWVHDFGRLASDGRVRRVVSHVQTTSGAWAG
ncbi:nuclear transport factor 2 family protein [Auritidibacter ignavus]|uniref:nuclear transport factor 2 family protein n=1 Tax=Auritidibacter ignavus TaxID=678932 RepID=UPI0024B8B0FF|nr:nuclear transport factor 2 family protein [Auritidibacter ignavus]WHS27905.1 nuclear transport factor 2 family protein [Auritidibacter ignavus]